MPDALRRWGLVERIGAADGGRVAEPPYSAQWYPGFGVRNGAAIRDYSLALAERVGEILDAGDFPVVLGGDCSILIGNALALRRRGRYGLVYIDGHLDFRHPGNTAAVGAAAGEDLAIVTGRGGDDLANIDGHRPYLRDADVAALGEREDEEESKDILDTEITVWNLAALRRIGMALAARKTLDRFECAGVEGFWVHIDADVLDDRIMPAVDSPQPDGLSYEELTTLAAPLLASELAAGLELTIYDPDLDPDGSIGKRFVDALVALFDRATAAV